MILLLLTTIIFFTIWSSYIIIRVFMLTFVNPNFDPSEEKEETIVVKYEDNYWDLFSRADNEFVVSQESLIRKCEELTKSIPELRVMDPEKEALQFVIAKRLEQLATCVLFETTPVGNVIMTYNAKKEVFEYYSDCTIPYRYLDTVCRKYVATFGCKPLYIDMNEEVKVSDAKTKQLREEKVKEREKEKEQEKEKEKEKEKETDNADVSKRKNVFAKFKTYNKDSGRGVPPKNSLPGAHKVDDSEPVVIKERTNKFLFMGKTMNFKTGSKVEGTKKKVSFAEFKAMTKK